MRTTGDLEAGWAQGIPVTTMSKRVVVKPINLCFTGLAPFFSEVVDILK
jgi:hypothetical protein